MQILFFPPGVFFFLEICFTEVILFDFNFLSVQHSGRYSAFRCNKQLQKPDKRENWKLKEDKWRWFWVRRWGVAGAVWNLCIEGNEHVAFWFSTHWHLVENIFITVKFSMWQLSSLAALFSQHWELRLRSGLVGNAKAEYHLIVYSGWILPRWMKIAYMMSICTDCIS